MVKSVFSVDFILAGSFLQFPYKYDPENLIGFLKVNPPKTRPFFNQNKGLTFGALKLPLVLFF